MIRFGLLGAGRAGTIHAGNLASIAGGRLVAVSDLDAVAAARIAGATGAEVRTPDAIIAAGDIDAVVIATPTDSHAALIELAARAGKAIFCEKPIDLDLARTEACIEVVRATAAPLMIGFNRRFDPTFAALKARVAAGAIGSVEMLTIVARDGAPPARGYLAGCGGIFRDMLIHDFDMARFILGEEFTEVHAVGSALIGDAISGPGDVDTVVVTLRSTSGKLCVITGSRRATYGRDQRIEVHGAGGMLRADNVLPTALELANHGGFARDPVAGPGRERFAAAFRGEIEAFVEALATNRPPAPSGDDGLQALRLAEAASNACISGRAVRL